MAMLRNIKLRMPHPIAVEEGKGEGVCEEVDGKMEQVVEEDVEDRGDANDF
ncbi:hypothetical protein WAI453_001071 [Rhynchosporium graminicola]